MIDLSPEMLRFRRGENVKPEDLQNTHIGGSTEDREQVDKGWGTGLAGCGVATIHYPPPPSHIGRKVGGCNDPLRGPLAGPPLSYKFCT